MKITVFTQGLSPIVGLILDKYGIQGVVESGPRGAVGKPTKPTRLETFCIERQIPYFWLVKNRRKDLVDFLRQRELELGVVYSMSQLLPEEVLNLFPRGIINAHPSLLPAYRGPNPYFRMFYDGATETGITIHYLDKGEDTGDVILQERIQIVRSADFDLYGLVKSRLGPLMLSALKQVEEGTVRRIPQPIVSPTSRAANVTVDTVEGLLRDLPLTLDDAAFFYQNTLGSLPLLQFGIRRQSGDWAVKRIIPDAQLLESKKVREWSRIYLTRHGFAGPHRDGWIVLKVRTAWLKFWMKVVRDYLWKLVGKSC